MFSNFNKCFAVLLVVGAATLPSAWTMNITVNNYFPEINRDLTKVTWAHAVNSHELLLKSLADPKIMMLEADVLMGIHGHPVMAHSKQDHSDLSLVQFMTAVIGSIHDGRRVGIKLDFKDINAVEPSLNYLRTRLDSGDTPNFPIIVNADILPGPVDATRKPLDAETFIKHAKKYTPFAMLSVGWTTRYGMDDPEDEIREGAYTKEQIKEMVKIIRKYAGEPSVFSQVTFPVRASLAAQSIDILTSFLLPRVRASEVSLTLWSPTTDSINKEMLLRLIQLTTSHRCFIDLPPSILGEEKQDDDPNNRNLRRDSSHKLRHHAQHPSEVGQLEGRGHSEHEHNHDHGNHMAVSNAPPARRIMALTNIFPVIAAGLVAAYIFNNRR